MSMSMSMSSGNEPPVEVDRVPETQFPAETETETDRFQLPLASDPYSMLNTEVLLDLFFSSQEVDHRFESPALARIDEESEMQCRDGFDDSQVAKTPRKDLFPGGLEDEQGSVKILGSAGGTQDLGMRKDNADRSPGYEQAGESDGETEEPSSYKNDDCELDEVNQIRQESLFQAEEEQNEVNHSRPEGFVEVEAEYNEVNQNRQESLVEAEAEQDDVNQIRQESLVEAEAEQNEVNQIRQESLVEGKGEQDTVVAVEPETSVKNEQTRREETSHKQDTITKVCTDQPMPRVLERAAPRSRKLNARRKLVPATEFDEDGWLCPSAHKKKHPQQGFLDGWLIRKRLATRCDV